MRYTLFLVVAFTLALRAEPASAQRAFRRAQIDSLSELRITLADKSIIRPPKERRQAGVDQVSLSADHRVVGWVVLYPNCCTSYPIPLKLILLRAGGRRTVISNGMPIWQWAFGSDGQSVVIRQAQIHGAGPTSYERRAIRTGRVIATAVTDSSTALPAWARAVVPTTSPSLTRER